ncbi:MAG: AmmeMemoRadiSam system protein B [Terriglobales bacterium]
MATYTRPPAVAGRFYPNNPETLLRDVQTYMSAGGDKLRALGCVAPHAGYMYSGHVAGAVYARLELPKTFIILCPNHTGVGQPLAIMSDARWMTPLGDVAVNSELASALKRQFPALTDDIQAHQMEHALEVQLPFLQALARDFSFVPIAVGTSRFEMLEKLGDAMASVIEGLPERPLIIASSDMNHYDPDQVTREKDHKAIETILTLDTRGLYDVVTQEGVSMCGFGPAIAMLTAAKRLGAKSAQVIKYATSGDVSGDREMVVGYAGIAVL